MFDVRRRMKFGKMSSFRQSRRKSIRACVFACFSLFLIKDTISLVRSLLGKDLIDEMVSGMMLDMIVNDIWKMIDNMPVIYILGLYETKQTSFRHHCHPQV